MTYFDLNWLLFSEPGTNLFIVGVNENHVDILTRAVRNNLMLPAKKEKRHEIRIENGSAIRFLKAEQLDEKTRGYSNVQVVFGDNITE